MAAFVHYDLQLIKPDFESPLVDVLHELEHLRRLKLDGTTPVPVFFQLKRVFHLLESLGSARIEGNHTTLADYVENTLEASFVAPAHSEQMEEIRNIEAAMAYVEEKIAPNIPVSEYFIRELHTIVVQGLTQEGDKMPGSYRIGRVNIAQSAHQPPDAVSVPGYMDELIRFINQDDPAKYSLIKVALAHHRFAWIHPFCNGNGRVVRLLTYALMIKYGFNVTAGGGILNPTAVFCNDRNMYYDKLAIADQGTEESLEAWCIYVLEGILVELRKVNQLTQYDTLKSTVLLPAIAYSKQRALITPDEETVLKAVIDKKIAKSSDLEAVMPKLGASQRTYKIRKLVEKGMLQPTHQGARQYTLGFTNNLLLRGIIQALQQKGFISEKLSGNTRQ